MRLLLFALLFMSPMSSFAVEPWMKNRNANVLIPVIKVQDGCPLSTAEMQSIVDGEWLRARLKKSGNAILSFQIKLMCLDVTVDGEKIGVVTNANFRFGKIMPHAMLYKNPDYDKLLLTASSDSGKRTVEITLRDTIAEALTEYLQANFGS